MIWGHDPLVDSALEQRYKRSVRVALKANPAERKRARKLRQSATTKGWISLILYTSIGFAAMWANLHSSALETSGRLGTASVVAFSLALIRRQLLWSELHASPALFPLTLWPVPVDAAFERQSSRGLQRRWICDLLTVGVCVCLVDNWYLGFLEAVGLLVGCIALRWLSQALAAILVLSSRFLWLGYISLGLFIALGYLKQLPGVASTVNSFWNSTGEAWSAVFPTGWVLRMVWGFLEGKPLSEAVWILPASAVLALMPWALRKLRASYEFREAVLLQYAAEPPESWDDSTREAHQTALVNVPTTVSPELLERLKAREFLTPHVEAPTFLDRLFLRWLTSRERTVLEWAQSGPLCLTRNVIRAAACVASGVAIIYGVAHGRPNPDPGWFVAAVTIFAMFWALRAGFMGRLFESIPSLTLQSPRIAFIPVALPEVARLLFKLALFYVPMVAILLFGLAVGMGWSMGREPMELARIGLGLAVAFPGILLLHLMMQASGPGSLTWRSTLAGLLLAGPPVFGFLGCLAIAAFWESPWSVVVALGGNLLVLVGFAGFRWIHQRRFFDLIGPIQS